MRVTFTRDYKGGKGEESYTKGQVIDLDQGIATQVIADGYAKEFPRSATDVAEQAVKYHAGDDKRTPAQIADRVPQIVELTGDTRSDMEEQRGENDPHEVRKEDEAVTEEAAEKKRRADERAKAEAAAATEKQRKADEAAAKAATKATSQ